VSDLTAVGSRVYIAGIFSDISGRKRKYLAAIDANTGAVLPWNPGMDGSVGAVEACGSTVFVSGDFRHADGRNARGVAALDTRTGKLIPWRPELPPGFRNLLALSATSAYFGSGVVVAVELAHRCPNTEH